MKPGEYKSTMNPTKPVSIEGHWQDPTPDEQEKHDTVHQLQTHLQEMKAQQKKTRKRLVIDTSKRLYTQPTMVCVPNCSFIRIFTVRNSSCGKVMFSQACVKNSVQGVVYTPVGAPPGIQPRADPLGRHHPGQTPPPPRQTQPPPPDGHCSGRYASYWNAFLCMLLLK